MTADLSSFSNRKFATLSEGIVIDPAGRVVCKKCGHAYMLSRFHKIESVQAVCCRGCGSTIRRDGSPLQIQK